MRRYAVKVDYDTPESANSGSQIFPYARRDEAAGFFHRMAGAYVDVQSVPVAGGTAVEIVGASIYQADDISDDHDMINAVKRGWATLIEDTTGFDEPN